MTPRWGGKRSTPAAVDVQRKNDIVSWREQCLVFSKISHKHFRVTLPPLPLPFHDTPLPSPFCFYLAPVSPLPLAFFLTSDGGGDIEAKSSRSNRSVRCGSAQTQPEDLGQPWTLLRGKRRSRAAVRLLGRARIYRRAKPWRHRDGVPCCRQARHYWTKSWLYLWIRCPAGDRARLWPQSDRRAGSCGWFGWAYII